MRFSRMWHVVMAVITSVIFVLAFHFIPRFLCWLGTSWINWEEDVITVARENPVLLIILTVLLIVLGALIDVVFIGITSKKKGKAETEE